MRLTSAVLAAFLCVSAVAATPSSADAGPSAQGAKIHPVGRVAAKPKKKVAKKSDEPSASERSSSESTDKKVKGAKDDATSKDSGKKGSAKDDDSDKSAPWYMQKPTDESQTQKTPDERGGVNPCMTKDPGFGVYEKWIRGISMGQMIMPARGGLTKSGGFDVIFHFHGHEPARKEWVKVMDGTVLVGIDLGIGSGAYSSAFSNPQTFKDLVESVENAVAKERDLPSAKARHIGLSAWSAGYGAVESILDQTYGKQVVDTVILLDGLHAGYVGDSLDRTELNPFIAFAKKAKADQKLMFITHSSIIPPGYASTTETSNFLIHELGGRVKEAKPRKGDPWGLELNAKFDAGNFHVRGYDGNDKMDHCAHFGLLPGILKNQVKPRWKTPKGQGPKKDVAAKK